MRPKPALLATGAILSLLMFSAGPASAGESGSARGQQIGAAAEALRPRLVETRRDLHRHPELSNREVRTAEVVAERLRELGLDEVRTNVAHHGVVALLKGALPGPVVALRADLDALPFQETLAVPYCSLVPGVKHACGHDAHTTIALGVAEVLSRMRGQIHGAVKFLFEPAEEGPPPGEEGGAILMIKEGALEQPRPSAIFGLHVTPELEAGLVGYRSGPAQASADDFSITITGKSVHAAFPDQGVDTIVVAAECVTALQTLKSRRLDTFEPVILTIGTIHGGNRPNIIAGEVKLNGTVRTLNEQVRNRIEQLMRETLAGVTAAYGATFDLRYERLTRVVFNDPKLVEESLPTLRRALDADHVVEFPQRMGAEDFSYYQQVVPGFLLRLGSGNKAKGITAQIHTPEFDIDEDCLVVGVKVMANLALDYLDHHANQK
jgi:amidohydrolase